MVKKYKRKTRKTRRKRKQIQRGGSANSAMVILEPRNHPKLKAILENAHTNMPPEWHLYVFHGEDPLTAAAAEAAVANIRQSRKVFLKSIGLNNMTPTDYNQKFQTKEFWNQVDAENILVFQTDSILCGKRNINDFIKYDYIGCPLNDSYGVKTPWPGPNEKLFYGTGGLSFRHKSFMLKCIDKYGNTGLAEDVLFSKCVHESPPERRPESSETLHQFCTQKGLPKFNQPSFGVHKLSDVESKDIVPLFEFCPDAKLLQ
jgi:hypothetical protein